MAIRYQLPFWKLRPPGDGSAAAPPFSSSGDLHYSATGLQWVVNAYVLTFAGFLLLGGRAADLFGQRRVYLSGMALFTVASLAGGIATDSAWLTTARAVQGIAGAVLSPATLTIIITTFAADHRARALGIWSAVAGAGGAAGSILRSSRSYVLHFFTCRFGSLR